MMPNISGTLPLVENSTLAKSHIPFCFVRPKFVSLSWSHSSSPTSTLSLTNSLMLVFTFRINFQTIFPWWSASLICYFIESISSFGFLVKLAKSSSCCQKLVFGKCLQPLISQLVIFRHTWICKNRLVAQNIS